MINGFEHSDELFDGLMSGVRLNKAIAAAGICSRRHADDLIFGGQVKVNGKIEKNPAYRMAAHDVLEVAGKRIESVPSSIYLMLNKPVEVICSVKDPQGRPTVMDYLPEIIRRKRVFPVGRLDYFSEGLLILTNDGDLSQKLLHPRYQIKKTYRVLVRGNVSESLITPLRTGMRLNDGTQLLPMSVDIESVTGGKSLLRIVLCQGINREIRRACEDLGLVILRLMRSAIGSLKLGNLAPGKIRHLKKKDLLNIFPIQK